MNDEERRFISDYHGTITIRAGGSEGEVWLGLSRGRNENEDPDINVKLSPAMQRRIAVAILEIGADPKPVSD